MCASYTWSKWWSYEMLFLLQMISISSYKLYFFLYFFFPSFLPFFLFPSSISACFTCYILVKQKAFIFYLFIYFLFICFMNQGNEKGIKKRKENLTRVWVEPGSSASKSTVFHVAPSDNVICTTIDIPFTAGYTRLFCPSNPSVDQLA